MIITFILFFGGFFVAGFIQEVLITNYHRALTNGEALRASIFSTMISILSLLVMAEVTRKIFDPVFGLFSFIFAISFAVGKGIGAYISIKKLHKVDNGKP